MNFLQQRPRLKKVLMLLVLLAAAPFALELLIFIEFGGIEAAFGCLLIMLKPFQHWISPKVQDVREVFSQVMLSLQQHRLSQPSVYFGHVAATTIMLLLSSSILVSACLWIPVLAINGQII
ncbi:hypothetical protein [Neptunicella sp. SCSIO 80796]|uniref:hypothetical protein n=1 Tax=Neptunicella plasticusilytica TaxID=3117012 RepID=UPI003A4DE414